MPRQPTYYRLEDGGATKRCSTCRNGMPSQYKFCRYCGLRFVKRPKRKPDRSVDTKLRAAQTARDEWMRKLSLALTKVKYYTRRAEALATKQHTPRPSATRAIRLRD